jgi:hypothetical protein
MIFNKRSTLQVVGGTRARRMSAAAYPLGVRPYTQQSLMIDYPGVHLDKLFATTTVVNGSLLGAYLHALRHSLTLPPLSTRQLVAASILRSRDRSATKEQILEGVRSWPSLQDNLVHHRQDLLIAMSVPDLYRNNLALPAVKTMKAVAELLDEEAGKYYTDFPL